MKAVTIGSAMIDTIAIIDPARIERMRMVNADLSFLLLEEGRKTEALEVSTHCGGGAVNAAVSLARLGLDVAALVKLGQDQRAETVMARLMSERVSTRWVLRDGREPTGASVLVASHDRNAAVFTFRGANTLLEPVDLRDDMFAADLVYIASLSNKSADCFPEAVSRAKAQGAFVAANPGIRQLASRGQEFFAALSKLDMLAINRTEAETLVPQLVAKSGEHGPELDEKGGPLPELAKRGLLGGGFRMSLAGFFKALRAVGAKRIIVTDGRNGAYLGTSEGVFHQPPAEAKAAGSTGAGDAFNSTFAAFAAARSAPAEALAAAAANSASVVEHIDTQSGLLKRDDLLARVKATKVPAARAWT